MAERRIHMPNAPRIVIVRLSAIGDVVHGMPVLCALRRTFPDAHLAWVVEGRAGDLLEGHESLDELIRVPRKWLKSPLAVWRLRARLKRLKADIAIDVQGLTKSALASRISGAPCRIGLDGTDGRELSRWLNNVFVTPSATHVVDRNLELLGPLGIERPPVEFRVPQAAAESCRMGQVLEEMGVDGPFAVVNPGAGWPSKLWPADRFGAVARELRRSCDLPTVVVWGGEEEYRLAGQVVAASSGSATLVPRTTLRELAALLRRARLMVASDTGPLHLAVAVGTPSVGLFGPMPHERNGPYGPRHAAVQRMCLKGRSRDRRRATNATMMAIQVDDVCEACGRLLSVPDEERARRIA